MRRALPRLLARLSANHSAGTELSQTVASRAAGRTRNAQTTTPSCVPFWNRTTYAVRGRARTTSDDEQPAIYRSAAACIAGRCLISQSSCRTPQWVRNFTLAHRPLARYTLPLPDAPETTPLCRLLNQTWVERRAYSRPCRCRFAHGATWILDVRNKHISALNICRTPLYCITFSSTRRNRCGFSFVGIVKTGTRRRYGNALAERQIQC